MTVRVHSGRTSQQKAMCGDRPLAAGATVPRLVPQCLQSVWGAHQEQKIARSVERSVQGQWFHRFSRASRRFPGWRANGDRECDDRSWAVTSIACLGAFSDSKARCDQPGFACFGLSRTTQDTESKHVPRPKTQIRNGIWRICRL